jgi:hypothetical protein
MAIGNNDTATALKYLDLAIKSIDNNTSANQTSTIIATPGPVAGR